MPRTVYSRVVVDTSIWSLAVRRRAGQLSTSERALVLNWKDLARDNLAVLIGPVRQEILTGIRDAGQFERLRDQLRGFEDEQLSAEDWETAAMFSNRCLTAGIAGSQTDLLICAFASARDLPIFTTDPDFAGYETVLPIRLF
jgi:predicted nucleic acid-binding protein